MEVLMKIFSPLVFCMILALTLSMLKDSEAAENINISWNSPVMNMDDSPLTDLSGYKIYYGIESNVYTHSINVGNVTTYRANKFFAGNTYYFTVKAYDHIGNESPYSNEVSLTISSPRKRPKPPKELRITNIK